MQWVIQPERARLVFSPNNFAIDLRTICSRDDVKAALRSLEREPFATPEVVREAETLLVNYGTWLQAQDKARKLRKS